MRIDWGLTDEKNKGTPNESCPNMDSYFLEGDGPYPLIVVCPGGGYLGRAHHEGDPVARWLNSIGISAVVLNYRVAPYSYPTALDDAQRAIRTLRLRAAEWNIDSNRIGILGFSAGGHLASTAGTHFDFGNPQATDPLERESCRPDVLVLCYPVITFQGEFAHIGSRNALLGDNPVPALVQLLSGETHVNTTTPPTFLWHTAEDEGVRAENSLQFAAALLRHRVPCELHVFERGPHGIGLSENYPGGDAWPKLCETWLRGRGF